ncbi:S8 family serine peptidase, partial [Arthrobacter sp. CAN_A1]|uniref:S8 family serine peptidase n=1 Tax=Arthrobacter sp. CAN_A1 TaxID=2787717 RepID=UPI0018C9659C
MTASPRTLLKPVASLSIAALLLGSLTAGPAVAQPASPSVDALPSEVVVPAPVLDDPTAEQPDRFIVKFKDTARASSGSRTDTVDVTEGLGVVVEELRRTGDSGVILEAAEDLTDGQIEDVVVALEARADVEYAEVDLFATTMATAPNDSLYPFQWSLFEAPGGMRVQDAWDTSVGTGITVAVIDTGSTPHSDLAANTVPGYDFITDPAVSVDGGGRDPDPSDAGDACGAETSSWHGTHVAGTIAAQANNTAGVAGVAHKAKVQHLRVMGVCGGWLSDIAPAIIWAAGGPVAGIPANPNPAQVINLSLGTAAHCGTTYQNAINYAVSQGVVVVAAAGNNAGDAFFTSPASCEDVITVGATSREGAQAPYSNFGSDVDVSAPGGDFTFGYEGGVLSTSNQGAYSPGAEAYTFMQGTSMAAPHVSGAAALMLSVNRNLTTTQVEQTLKDSARPLPGSCFGGCGTGIVDASAAVNAVAPQLPDVVGAVPTISGDPRVGSTLTVGAGSWGPTPVALAYQWLRNGAAISGATAITYHATAADAGRKLSVKVTGRKTGFDSATRTSAQTAVITDPASDVVAPTPVISNSGTAKVGVALTTTIGTWKPAPTVLTYQWLRDGAVLPGATAATYTPVAADLGKTLKIQVTGKSGSLASTVRSSSPSKTVLPGVLAAVKPTVSGFAAVGYTLTAASGLWASGTTVSYQWLRGGVPISGARSITYQPVAADATKRLSVKATGVKAGYTTSSSTSIETDAVPVPFKDVPVGTQFHQEMSWLAAEGISTGWTEANGTRTYRPLTSVNRDAMAAFMYRMAGSPSYTAPARSPFGDVSTN